MECPRKKHCVRDLNEFFTCKLCHGYLVDATTLVECLHTFCRGCILRHFENSKTQTQCPVCPVLYKKKSQCFRSDKQLQALVYKSIPSLYLKEIQRREDFYRSTGVRAGSSCSDDSVIDKERDMIHETEEMISQIVGDKSQYFSQDDSISLSLEYYQANLDTTDLKTNSDLKCTSDQLNNCSNRQIFNNSDKSSTSDKQRVCDKRYLQCPAGVNMKHLQKFVRMKYGLSGDHRVDIIYKGEVLPNDFSLMDVAYTFKWEKKKPMRFFYRIFTPMKIRPIKIVNTPTATGGKQLQIVPVTNIQPVLKSPTTKIDIKETESEQQDKERLMANLQLQSKTKAMQIEAAKKVQPDKIVKDYIYEYEEPDQEEIKRFAEKRDREWALQKKLEEETKADNRDIYFPTKKRKKSKHSKNDSNGHKEKKRKPHGDKIHAEITNNDKSDFKLKLKITNGHKHKHHKIENNSEVSHKEKLLQMRQVRHKHAGSGDEQRTQQPAIPIIKLPKSFVESNPEEPEAKRRKENPPNNINENNNKPLTMESPQNHHQQAKPKVEPIIVKPIDSRPIPGASRPMPQLPSKVAKKEASIKPIFDLNQKTFLKAASANTDKHSKDQKISQSKMENNKTSMSNKVLPIGSITTNNKILDRKIANLQQRCTIEPKTPSNNGKIANNTEKTKILNPQYPRGFTVSKIESGVKRPASQEDNEQDKRPSLEITLIPPLSSTATKSTEAKSVNKRPPPGTIPLERIKNAVNLKSGISIIPKMPPSDNGNNNSRTDSNGVLDLSKTKSSAENSQKSSKTEPINGLNSMVNRQINNMTPRPMSSSGAGETGTKNNMQLSNLQMLSKVATEHPTLNKLNPTNNKVRPQMPNLQTINKMASPIRTPGIQRMPPKLNEIQQKFRPTNPQIRNMRPNQNQNIRNIPNPSLMLNRHQNMNQARLVVPTGNNSVSTTNSNVTVGENCTKRVSTPKSSPVSSAVTSTTTTINNKEVQPSLKSAIIEQKVMESKEISV